MARLHGSKNRKTLLRESEEVLEHSHAPREIADSVHVMEAVMMHFYTQVDRSLGTLPWPVSEAVSGRPFLGLSMAAIRSAVQRAFSVGV